jgi:hypothetical protein
MSMRAAVAAVGITLSLAAITMAEDAKGTVTFKAKSGPVSVAIKHAYLVKGPDVVTRKPIRRIVFSVADVGAKLKECSNMMCSDGGIVEGMTVDLDAGPRANYWFVANDQRVQHSGTADMATMKLTTNTPERVAGTWDYDGSAGGGPVVKVSFDVTLIKELK